MTLLGEASGVIPQGFPLLLSATPQIPRNVGSHVRSMKVTGEDLLEILPTIDRVYGQVIEPSSGHVGQVDGEELDDEEVIVHPSCHAHEVVVHQLDARIGLAIILDDVVGCTEKPREAHIMQIALE
jgi:hypothetical protein